MISATLKRLCDFLDASPTAYHAVDSMSAILEARGAQRLHEGEAWKLEPGRSYFVTRSGSALIAFRPGLRPPAEEGFALAGAHTDSPALKARLERPLNDRGIERGAVEIYGDPIRPTWVDRPLSLAGRVLVSAAGAPPEMRLVNFGRPVGIIPNLAIHLNHELNTGFAYNPQLHLPVLFASHPDRPETGKVSVSALLDLVAAELEVPPEAILGADLFFVESQKSLLIGEDLVNGYRLDDLLGCHAILEAFLAAPPTAHGQIACFFDNEEVGSHTAQGADSSFLRDLLARVAALQGTNTEGFYRAIASSFMVSVDVAQAFHPSYGDKFDEHYTPLLNGGPAIKANANFRYATDAESEVRFRRYCAELGLPCQKLLFRADTPPGTTIGPLASSFTGIRTVDVGSPLLSMHSLRETAGSRDHEAMARALELHFRSSPRE